MSGHAAVLSKFGSTPTFVPTIQLFKYPNVCIHSHHPSTMTGIEGNPSWQPCQVPTYLAVLVIETTLSSSSLSGFYPMMLKHDTQSCLYTMQSLVSKIFNLKKITVTTDEKAMQQFQKNIGSTDNITNQIHHCIVIERHIQHKKLR